MSAVIPAFNASATIGATLRSARAQTHRALEIIVVDDGSSDTTAELVEAHCREDRRIRRIAQENLGLAAARNSGIAVAEGAFIATLDADDLWHPEKIERQMAAMRRGGAACGLAYGLSADIDEHDYVVTEPDLRSSAPAEGYVLPELIRGNFIANGSSPLMLREAIEAAGGYDPGLRAQGAEGCEDFKLYLAIAAAREFAAVPITLTGYRLGRVSMSRNVDRMIRSHRIVTEPYRATHPDEVRAGRVYLALYYAGREFGLGAYGPAVSAFRAALQADPAASGRATIRRLLRRFGGRAGVHGGATDPKGGSRRLFTVDHAAPHEPKG